MKIDSDLASSRPEGSAVSAIPRPFLKWAGGKGKLAETVISRAPATFGRYHEPFLGGGAVFFALRRAGFRGPASLADLNADLVAAYRTVGGQADALVAALQAHADAYLPLDRDGRGNYYYACRAGEPEEPVARAARLIFLNRTCYNGLYRVNASGRFNVPHGRYTNPRIVDAENLRAVAAALADTSVGVMDFGEACGRAVAGDLVYLDPPYRPLSATARFTSYTREHFGPAEQVRLRDVFDDLTARGVAAMLSNSDHLEIRELYGGRGYGISRVPMGRSINSNTRRRAPIDELLIDNFARAGFAPEA